MGILDSLAVDAPAEITFPFVYVFAFLGFRNHGGKQLEGSLDFRVINGFVTIKQMAAKLNDGFSNLEVVGRAQAGDDIFFDLWEQEPLG